MKKAILLSKENYESISTELDAVMGRATTHAYTAADLLSFADQSEKRLERLGLTKKERLGVIVVYRSGTPTSNAYKRSARSCLCTSVSIVRRTTGWFVTDIGKVSAYAGSNPAPQFCVKEDILMKCFSRLTSDIHKI
jgi:hypothetical protein